MNNHLKRFSVILIFTFSSIFVFSQNTVTGVITSAEDGLTIPGVSIFELGTSNSTESDIEGKFQITTINNPCTIQFSFIGLEPKIVKVSNDTILNIELTYGDYYNTRWLAFGANYDLMNSTFGFVFSNGFDEKPLIHFEDYQDYWSFKLSGSTNFDKNYSYGAKLSTDIIRYFVPTMEFTKYNYISNNFDFTEVNISAGRYLRFIDIYTYLKVGYNNLNTDESFGVGLGLRNSHRNPHLYYGFFAGYWSEYFTYNIYFQSFIYKKRLGVRLSYDRIDKYDFLSLGLHYAFVRN